jgi:hypothetical protein
MAEDLVALGLTVLEEVTALLEGVARLAEGLRLQAELGLDDVVHDEAAGGGAAAQAFPEVPRTRHYQESRSQTRSLTLSPARCAPRCPASAKSRHEAAVPG